MAGFLRCAVMVNMQIDTGTDQLLTEIRDGVAVITLNRPEARNALSDTLTPALRQQIADRGADRNVGALLITGAGTAFCAGGDVKSMAARPEPPAAPSRDEMTIAEKITQLQHRQRTLTGALVGVRKPTIAALPGPAAGAGLAIALACDIRFAAHSAFISTGYARVGLSGDYGIAWLLTRLVGTAKARELMFTAERVDAETCQQIGLVNRLVGDADLQSVAFGFARSLADGPTAALRQMKENLDTALTAPFLSALDAEAERLVHTAQSADHKEAVRAFVEKRKPNFTGQ
jgi:enoyl-CoA hydratase/carnithine racemase